ncbi:MAG: type II toxin-antitoxin system CcdA family antitoxin [Acidimicrobiia bacterium]
MARLNIYFPDDLARAAKASGLNISGLAQEAVRSALAASATDDWFDAMARLSPLDIDPVLVRDAVAGAKDDLERGRG